MPVTPIATPTSTVTLALAAAFVSAGTSPVSQSETRFSQSMRVQLFVRMFLARIGAHLGKDCRTRIMTPAAAIATP